MHRDMAFRLRPEESVAHGLRRLARKELKAARKQLQRHAQPTDEAVHEARKSLKKASAIAGLLEADGTQGVGRFDKRRRRANRILSKVRDSAANVEILHKLKVVDPALISAPRFRRLRRRLQQRRVEARRTAGEHDDWQTVQRDLRRLEAQVKQWRPKHRHFKALASGIERSLRVGHKALRRAQRRQDAADFHELRKQVKQLWYALRLLEACGAGVKRDAARLHSLESWLGDDHNVLTLTTELEEDRSVCQGLIDVDRLRLAGHQLQCGLRTQAVRSASRFYGKSVDDYVQRLKRTWRSCRQRRRQ
jgi:CHAD domain-containing protein